MFLQLCKSVLKYCQSNIIDLYKSSLKPFFKLKIGLKVDIILKSLLKKMQMKGFFKMKKLTKSLIALSSILFLASCDGKVSTSTFNPSTPDTSSPAASETSSSQQTSTPEESSQTASESEVISSSEEITTSSSSISWQVPATESELMEYLNNVSAPYEKENGYRYTATQMGTTSKIENEVLVNYSNLIGNDIVYYSDEVIYGRAQQIEFVAAEEQDPSMSSAVIETFFGVKEDKLYNITYSEDIPIVNSIDILDYEQLDQEKLAKSFEFDTLTDLFDFVDNYMRDEQELITAFDVSPTLTTDDVFKYSTGVNERGNLCASSFCLSSETEDSFIVAGYVVEFNAEGVYVSNSTTYMKFAKEEGQTILDVMNNDVEPMESSIYNVNVYYGEKEEYDFTTFDPIDYVATDFEIQICTMDFDTYTLVPVEDTNALETGMTYFVTLKATAPTTGIEYPESLAFDNMEGKFTLVDKQQNMGFINSTVAGPCTLTVQGGVSGETKSITVNFVQPTVSIG